MMFGAFSSVAARGKDEFPKLPTETILNRLSDCRPPGDKRMISEYMEMVELKLEMKPVETAKEFFRYGGIQIIFKIMRTMKNGMQIIQLRP